MTVTETEIASLYEVVMDYYRHHARLDLPWRQPEPNGHYDPYKILVSELMLQQTQVGRVVPKYGAFIALFPNVETLASATLGDVLRAWQGLGYNRRAKYLWLSAQQIAKEGWPDDLTSLPGVGVNTAGAIRAYAFNEPVVFVETNIRTVYIYHFAATQQNIPDSFIQELLAQTLRIVTSQGEPRDFYWALMDYGTYLKTMVRNVSQSKQYKRQPTFKGSNRQLRGLVVRILADRAFSVAELHAAVNDDRLEIVLIALESEGLIVKRAEKYELSQ